MNDITPKEAIANLNHLYGMVAPDIQRSLDVAIKALERPQGDFISREALKEVFLQDRCGDNFLPKHFVISTIDLAPTVFSCNACKNMGNERECVDCHDYSNYVHYEETPQGEWIKWSFKTFGAMGDWEYKCSKCEKVYGGEYNFCPNCGARMKGGAK